MRQIIETVTDDLNDDPDAITVNYTIDGIEYEVDLAERSRAKFDKALAPFIEVSRRVGGRKKSSGSKASRSDLSAVRSWAAEQGMEVSERGRVSGAILSAYDAAH